MHVNTGRITMASKHLSSMFILILSCSKATKKYCEKDETSGDHIPVTCTKDDTANKSEVCYHTTSALHLTRTALHLTRTTCLCYKFALAY